MRALARVYSNGTWRLDGRPRRIALIAGASFAAVAVLALAVDLRSGNSWDAQTLQASALFTQVAAGLGLWYLGRIHRSRGFVLLAVLVTLVAFEEAFHILNPLAELLSSLARAVADLLGLRAGVLAAGFIYGFVAAAGFALIILAYLGADVSERRVVLNLTILLVVGGIFAGPVGALGHLGNPRFWVHLEEFGEAIVFTAVGGYVAGLVALSPSFDSDANRLGGLHSDRSQGSPASSERQDRRFVG